jgi:hypothetical protein
VSGLTVPVPVGGARVFIIRFNNDGIAQWISTIQNNTASSFIKLALSKDDLYVCSTFLTALTLFNSDGLASGITAVPTLVVSPIFIAKYTKLGTAIWATKIESTAVGARSNIRCDETDVYITGEFSGTVTFYNSDQSVTPITYVSAGGLDVFFAKYSAAGVANWATRFSNVSVANAGLIRLSKSGYAYVTIFFLGTITLFNANGVSSGIIFTSLGSSDLLLVKYNSDGFLQWGTRVGSTGADSIGGLDVSLDESIYMSGGRNTSASLSVFNSNNTLFKTITSTATSYMFLIKYDKDGQGIWATKIENTALVVTQSISSLDNNPYITISYTSGNPVIYNSDDSVNPITFQTGGTCGLVKYDSNGFAIWAATVAGAGTSPVTIVIDNSGDIFYSITYFAGVVTIYNSDKTVAFVIPYIAAGSNGAVIKYHDQSIDNYTLGNPYNNGLSKLLLANAPTTVTSSTPIMDGEDKYTVIAFETNGSSIKLVYNIIGRYWNLIDSKGVNLFSPFL